MKENLPPLGPPIPPSSPLPPKKGVSWKSVAAGIVVFGVGCGLGIGIYGLVTDDPKPPTVRPAISETATPDDMPPDDIIAPSGDITDACREAVYEMLPGALEGEVPSFRPTPCEGLTDEQWIEVVVEQTELLAESGHTVDQTSTHMVDAVTDGTYEVGVDIAAGTYETGGPKPDNFSPRCYWERAEDDTGDLFAIIENDNITDETRVTVTDGDFFTTARCQDWHLVK